MTKPIGLTFIDECRAAGVADFRFAAAEDGSITFDPAMPAAEIAKVEAAYMAHDPAAIAPRQALADKLAAGVVITSASAPALDGTYALDGLSRQQIQDIAVAVSAGLGFPENGPLFVYPDINGAPHEFGEAQFVAFYKTIRDYVYRLNLTAAALAAGQSADWPAQPVAIV